MATVTNWIDHLSASEVQGAIYPGVGSEGILVILGFIIWIGWHVIAARRKSTRLNSSHTVISYAVFCLKKKKKITYKKQNKKNTKFIFAACTS